MSKFENFIPPLLNTQQASIFNLSVITIYPSAFAQTKKMYPPINAKIQPKAQIIETTIFEIRVDQNRPLPGMML